jgi:hypothetical protein
MKDGFFRKKQERAKKQLQITSGAKALFLRSLTRKQKSSAAPKGSSATL